MLIGGGGGGAGLEIVHFGLGTKDSQVFWLQNHVNRDISSAAAPQRKYRFPLRKARILPASPNFVCDGRMETSDAAECSPNIPPDNDPCPTKIAHQT